MINIDELEKLAKGATPGTWHYDKTKELCDSSGKGMLACCEYSYDILDKQNAQYIASANPEAMLKLIAELRALRNVATAVNQMLLTVDDEGYLPRFGIDEALAEWRKLGGGE